MSGGWKWRQEAHRPSEEDDAACLAVIGNRRKILLLIEDININEGSDLVATGLDLDVSLLMLPPSMMMSSSSGLNGVDPGKGRRLMATNRAPSANAAECTFSKAT